MHKISARKTIINEKECEMGIDIKKCISSPSLAW
jgi:hypothetical protein